MPMSMPPFIIWRPNLWSSSQHLSRTLSINNIIIIQSYCYIRDCQSSESKKEPDKFQLHWLLRAVRIWLLCSCASAVTLPSPVHPESWVLSPESTGSQLICVPPAQRKLQAKPGAAGRKAWGIRMRTETKQLKGASSMPTLPAEDLSSCSGSVWVLPREMCLVRDSGDPSPRGTRCFSFEWQPQDAREWIGNAGMHLLAKLFSPFHVFRLGALNVFFF